LEVGGSTFAGSAGFIWNEETIKMMTRSTLAVLAVAGMTLLGGCTAKLSEQDRSLLESTRAAASQAQQSATAAAQSASQAQQSAAQAQQSATEAAQSATAAQTSAQQAEQIFKKMQHK
jgi:Sec-independent protein translocase protein TatA